MDAVFLILVVLGVLGGIVSGTVRSRRARRGRQLEADAFADAMRSLGLVQDPIEAGTWRLERSGQRLQVDAHPPSFATVMWTRADVLLDDARFVQEFSDDSGRAVSRMPAADAASDAATQAMAPLVREFLGGGTDAVFQSVQFGPGIVAVGVTSTEQETLHAAIERVLARSEGLLRVVDEAYASHAHLPVLSASDAARAFDEAIAVPGAIRDPHDAGCWSVPLRGADLTVEFPGRTDIADLSWTTPSYDDRPSEFYGVAALARRPDGRLVTEDVSELDSDPADRGSGVLASLLARWAPRLEEHGVLDVLIELDTVELSVWGAGPEAAARNVEGVAGVFGALCDELLATLGTDASPPESARPPAPTPEPRGPFL
ncbi:MAG: hypothetical protein JWM98_826 [Thermoleophilia bacterium]|nr:hypothetical protein [Thermoleophilia bacterium]